MRKGLFIVIGVWLAIASCQEIKDCELESSTEYAWINFYEADSLEQYEKTVAFSVVTEESSNFYLYSTLDEDTSAYDTTTFMPLWLNSQSNEVHYLFETDSINYELTMLYTPHLRVYYDECEPVYSFKLDTAYSSDFDSVVIVNEVLDWTVGSNVEVYF
ncbi:MAG: hypothetical protein CMB80_06740 [Flammeovirgaceae bacterium]|nr:hypothetical protein [Flammeovirgaceae bacterium]MBE62202.1 hypothetical protein [Flammeovirgaceae bacterium]HCX20306.1 hypothetical protein [Cytophagales bacterium]|tara:strand:+ start:4521 stop:4997 length:477 start_codon:yes stop_codon:yes gene_type:complete